MRSLSRIDTVPILRPPRALIATPVSTPREHKVIVVLAAVIERDGRILITQRPEHTHLGGLWEFPGGKCEPGETHTQCLERELREELGVQAVVGDELLVTDHAYPERTVRLHFRRCTITGEPAARLGQAMRWIRREDLDVLEFPPADRELIENLKV